MKPINVWLARDKGFKSRTFLHLEAPERVAYTDEFFTWESSLPALLLPTHYGLRPGQIKRATITIKEAP
jgi:hypothetical protein